MSIIRETGMQGSRASFAAPVQSSSVVLPAAAPASYAAPAAVAAPASYAAPAGYSYTSQPVYTTQYLPQAAYYQQPYQQVLQQPYQVVQQQPYQVVQQPYQQSYVLQQGGATFLQPQGIVSQPQGFVVQPQPAAPQPQPVAPQPVAPQPLAPDSSQAGELSGNTNSATEDDAAPQAPQGQVHMLITGIDYACDRQSWAGPPPNGNGPLDTKFAFEMMKDLAYKCGANYLTLWNEQCTRAGILQGLRQVGAHCGPGDTLIFYYTGHGDQLPNLNRMEGERFDQCFCLVDSAGNTDDKAMTLRNSVWMRDDEFAKGILDAVGHQVKVLVLVDACHSGTICDFTPQSEWARRRQQAISISGCEDTQTSAGTGKGGMFTRALTRAVQDLQGRGSYNVSTLYNKTLEHYAANKLPGHTQNIAIHGCVVRPKDLAWPLQPKVQYVSPANMQWRSQPVVVQQPATGYSAPVVYSQQPMVQQPVVVQRLVG